MPPIGMSSPSRPRTSSLPPLPSSRLSSPSPASVSFPEPPPTLSSPMMSSLSAPFMTLRRDEVDVETAVALRVEDLVAAVGAGGVAARAAAVHVARRVRVALAVDQVVVTAAADTSSRPLPPVRSSSSRPAAERVVAALAVEACRSRASRAARRRPSPQAPDEALDCRAVVAVAELDLRDVLGEAGRSPCCAFTCSQSPFALTPVQVVVEAQPAVRGSVTVTRFTSPLAALKVTAPERGALPPLDVGVGRRGRGGGRHDEQGSESDEKRLCH